VPDHPVVGWWRVWLARYGHLLMTGAATDGSRVAATMSTWLEADPTRPPSVRPGRLVPLLSRPYLAVHGGLTAAPGALVRVLTGHRYGVFALAWSPDGSRLMTGGGADQQVRLWDAATGATTVTLTGHTDWVHAVAWSSDGTSLASADNGGIVRLWSATGTPTATHDAGSPVHALSWSPDGTRLASGHSDATVHLWDVATGAVRVRLTRLRRVRVRPAPGDSSISRIGVPPGVDQQQIRHRRLGEQPLQQPDLVRLRHRVQVARDDRRQAGLR